MAMSDTESTLGLSTAAGRYRVWCLSWDESDDEGADVVAYEIATHDYATEARGVIYVGAVFGLHLYSGGAIIAPNSAADAALAYAEHVYRQRDGYESTWPLAFRVRSPDGSTTDFEVACEHVPQFSALAIKRSEQKRDR
jgi:hypothetical protein